MAEAKLIAVGRVVSSGESETRYLTFDFAVSEFLKGTPPRVVENDPYYLAVDASEKIAEFLALRDREYILLLSEERVQWSPARDIYFPLAEGERSSKRRRRP